MSGHLVYECRMCGEKIAGPFVPSIPHALFCAFSGATPPVSWHGVTAIPQRITHDCRPGRVGVAELCGGAGEDTKALMRNRPGTGCVSSR